MKVASYLVDGQAAYGVVGEGGLVTVSRRLGDRFPTLRAVLAGNGLEEVRAAAAGQAADTGLDDIDFLPVIPNPEKVLCIGLNYESHRLETGRPEVENPTIFTRFANSQIGHGQPIVRPRVSTQLDFEGELAVIVGRAGRHVAEADALGHVAGYACFNDGSVRDWQRHTSQFAPGKNFVGTGPFGPWLVTTDEVADPTALTLETRVNGKVVQHATTDDLIFGIPRLIAYISTFTELAPGDVIATGTPGGVGFKRTPPLFLKPGDTVEVEITGLGVLRNPVVDE